MFKIKDGRDKFYQWDIDRKLIVEDASITEVHFSNRTDDYALVVKTYIENGITLANVPNILLQTNWRIHVYAVDGNYTKHEKCYEIVARTKPSDYVYTETEIINWQYIKTQLDSKADVLDLEKVEADLDNKADKATTISGYGITDAYTKTEVDNNLSGTLKDYAKKTDIADVYKPCGSKDVYTLSYYGQYTHSPSVGDVYNVSDSGQVLSDWTFTQLGVEEPVSITWNSSTNVTIVFQSIDDMGTIYADILPELNFLLVYISPIAVTKRYKISSYEPSFPDSSIQVILENGPSGAISGYEVTGFASKDDVKAGDNVVWIGHSWDKLSATIDLSGYQKKLTFDNTPTADSTNPVTSGGVKTALDGKLDKTDVVGKKTTAGGEIFNSYDGEFPNVASGSYSHAEGLNTQATGDESHAEGAGTKASGSYSHAEGLGTNAIGVQSHAEGWDTSAIGDISHAEGNHTKASGIISHAEGNNTRAGSKAFQITNISINGETSVLTLSELYAGNAGIKCSIRTSTAVDNVTIISVNPVDCTVTVDAVINDLATSSTTDNPQNYLVLIDYPTAGNFDIGYSTHAEGVSTIAYAPYSHSEGKDTKAVGQYSHAEGRDTLAGYASHAEGRETEASGNYSHAEGHITKAVGHQSHAEGNTSVASGETAHAEGNWTVASGDNSHSEGDSTKAVGHYSHSEGYCTVASKNYQHVQGKFNIEDTTANGYAHIVGNGKNLDNRSNAHTLDWNGNAWYAGTVEGTALILKSPSGNRFQITVSDSGTLTTTAI